MAPRWLTDTYSRGGFESALLQCDKSPNGHNVYNAHNGHSGRTRRPWLHVLPGHRGRDAGRAGDGHSLVVFRLHLHLPDTWCCIVGQIESPFSALSCCSRCTPHARGTVSLARSPSLARTLRGREFVCFSGADRRTPDTGRCQKGAWCHCTVRYQYDTGDVSVQHDAVRRVRSARSGPNVPPLLFPSCPPRTPCLSPSLTSSHALIPVIPAFSEWPNQPPRGVSTRLMLLLLLPARHTGAVDQFLADRVRFHPRLHSVAPPRISCRSTEIFSRVPLGEHKGDPGKQPLRATTRLRSVSGLLGTMILEAGRASCSICL